jgi:hypothetical protein
MGTEPRVCEGGIGLFMGITVCRAGLAQKETFRLKENIVT